MSFFACDERGGDLGEAGGDGDDGEADERLREVEEFGKGDGTDLGEFSADDEGGETDEEEEDCGGEGRRPGGSGFGVDVTGEGVCAVDFGHAVPEPDEEEKDGEEGATVGGGEGAAWTVV